MEEDDNARWNEFNNWTSYGKAEFKVDGLEIHQLLDRVKSQLSILKRQQDLTNEVLKQFSTDDTSEVSSKEMLIVNEKLRRLEILLEKCSESLQTLETRVSDTEILNESKINKLQSTLDIVMKKNEELLEREEKSQKKIGEIEKLIFTSVRDLKDRFDHFADQSTTESNKMNQSLTNIKTDVKILKDKTEDLDMRTVSLKDHVVVTEMKMKTLENRSNENAVTVLTLKEGLESIPTTFIEPIQKAIEDLNNEKADRIELSEKADISMIMSRAEVNEVIRVEEKVDEIGRRITGIDSEIKENVKTFDGKLDRKGERIAQWVLKIIRKEQAPSTAVKEGTDIGKVKCLVCDQVVPQNAEAGGTVFGGPGMKNVIKELHRNRSSSPTNSPENRKFSIIKNNNGAPLILDDELPDNDKTHDQTSEVKISQQMNLLPKLQTAKHSKIVKLMSAPLHPIDNSASSVNEDGNNENDFKYRVQTHEQLNLQEHDGRPLETNPLIPTSGVNYFKDLEDRYHNFNSGSGRKNHSSSKRPTTAPIRK